ncbi:hypothetical protein M0Q50_02690 [bacterium]|jgi:hypothetical protein|nr:hypothetical protein [bacterium]
MKTFEKFNTIDEKEEQFLGFAHLDELDIKFDFIEYEIGLFYFYKEIWIFGQEKKYKYFYINKYFWDSFESNFGLNYQETKVFLSVMLDKYLNLSDYIISNKNRIGIIWVTRHFKY